MKFFSQLCSLFADLPRKDVNNLLEKISPVYEQCRVRPASFAESHVSANTFWENKRGLHQQATQQWTIRLVPSWQQQQRGFKTHRSDINHQNPSVTERLRSKLLAMDNKRVALGSIHDATSGGNVKGLLSDNLGTEEQSRIKVLYLVFSHDC